MVAVRLPRALRQAQDGDRALIGRPLTEHEYEALSEDVRLHPDMVLTGFDTDSGQAVYVFVKTIEGHAAMILAITHGCHIRTMFPAKIAWWLAQHVEMVEVTDRVNRIRY